MIITPFYLLYFVQWFAHGRSINTSQQNLGLTIGWTIFQAYLKNRLWGFDWRMKI